MAFDGSAGTLFQGALGWFTTSPCNGEEQCRAKQVLPAREFCSEALYIILATGKQNPGGHQGFPVCDHSADSCLKFSGLVDGESSIE